MRRRWDSALSFFPNSIRFVVSWMGKEGDFRPGGRPSRRASYVSGGGGGGGGGVLTDMTLAKIRSSFEHPMTR